MAMRRREFLYFTSMGFLSGPALISGSAQAHTEPADRTPAAGRQVVQIPAPSFTLRDQGERSFDFQAWRQRAVAVTFGYTTCPDICPLLAANFALIQQDLPESARTRVGLLFITTDPERDTPAVLQAYGTRFAADFATWKFLSGDVAQMRLVWRGFGVSVQKFGSGQVDHTMLTTLVDRDGLRRVNYYGTRWGPQTLRRDLVALAHGELSQL
jgi:protein SCO1/2